MISVSKFAKEADVYGRPWRFVLIALLLIGTAAAVGYYAYQAGMARGVAESASITAPPAGAMPMAPFYFHPRPFGFGFGGLGCLVPILFFFLFFGLLKSMFWGGRWGWGHGHGMGGHKYGPEGSDVPPMFREWYRRMHEEKPAEDLKPKSA
ncbi:MAG: hypothetical protein WD040_04810 [Anaerolineales bacterium]